MLQQRTTTIRKKPQIKTDAAQAQTPVSSTPKKSRRRSRKSDVPPVHSALKIGDYFVPSTGGLKIYVEVSGTLGKPVIVFNYGLVCYREMFHHQLQYFKNDYTLVTYDYRGHGQSDFPARTEDFSIHGCAQDLLAVVDFFKIERAFFMGHSMGVPVIAQFLLENDERSLGSIWINGFLSDPSDDVFFSQSSKLSFNIFYRLYKSNPFWSQLWHPIVTQKLSAFFIKLGGFNVKTVDLKDVQTYLDAVGKNGAKTFFEFCQNITRLDLFPEIHRIKSPVLIIGGDFDLVTTVKYSIRMHRLLPQSELLVIPYGSHCTLWDFPEYVNLRIEKFLRQLQDKNAK